MSNSVFSELRFWLTVILSLGLPCGIYTWLLVRRAVSRGTVLWLGISLVAIAGFDVYFLSSLATAAKQTPSLADDGIFLSEVSLALYLLPAMFGGIGVNLVSHVLVSHLAGAEKRFVLDQQKAQRRSPGAAEEMKVQRTPVALVSARTPPRGAAPPL